MENVGVSLQNLYCIKKGFDIVFSLNGILQFWAEQIIVLFLCVFILFFHVVAESEQKLSLQNWCPSYIIPTVCLEFVCM